MSPRIPSLLGLALPALLAAVAPPRLGAQAPTPVLAAVEDVLPDSTYAVLRFGGLRAGRAAATESPFAPLVANALDRLPDEVRRQRLEGPLQQAARQLERALRRAGLSAADVQQLLQQPMALAVGRLSVEGLGPSLALVVEAGEAGAAIERCFDALLQLPARFGEQIDVDTIRIDGVPVRHAVLAEGPPLFAASFRDRFVLTNSRGYLTEMIAVGAGQLPPLATAGPLAAWRAELAAPALASMFLNTSRVLSAFAPHLPYEAAAFGDALGVASFDGVYAALAADAQGGTDVLRVGLAGSADGVLKALVARPLELGFLAACSPNTVAFGAASLDPAALLAAIGRFVELLPVPLRDELRDGELGRLLRAQRADDRIGSLLRAFGGQVSFALALENGAVPKPELLVRLALTAPQDVEPWLARLEGQMTDAGAELRSRTVDGHQIRFTTLPLPDAGLQLTPCYVLLDDALWFGSDVQALVRMLRSEPEQSLATAPDVAALAATSGGANGVLHLRAFRAVEVGWRQVETLLYPQLDAHQDELGFDSAALPGQDELAAALGVTTWTLQVGDDGVLARCDGPLTLGALLAAVASLGDATFDRVLLRERQR